MPIQPVPIGQQGTATFRPNWGQPIMDGQWQGQPQATPAIDPREVINTKLQLLRANFKRQANTLRASGLDADVHNRILAGWQNEYDQAKAELTGVTTQLGLIEQGVGAGQMTAEAGREAAIRMIMPRETVDLMFPSVRAKRPGGFAPSQYNTTVEAFAAAGQASIVNPWGWGKGKEKRSDPELLKEEYFNARAVAGYDVKSRADKIAFDIAWDDAQDANKHTKKTWKQLKEDVEIKTSRTYDARLLEIAAKKANGDSLSPMAKSLNKQKLSKWKMVQAASPIGAALLYRELAAKRRAANQAMPKPTTREEYNKLPSGTQYIDTDGQMRTKK